MAKYIIKFCVVALLILGQQVSLASELLPISAIQQSSSAMAIQADASCDSMPECLDGNHQLCSSECAGSPVIPEAMNIISHGVVRLPVAAYLNNSTDPILSPPDPPPQA